MACCSCCDGICIESIREAFLGEESGTGWSWSRRRPVREERPNRLSRDAPRPEALGGGGKLVVVAVSGEGR